MKFKKIANFFITITDWCGGGFVYWDVTCISGLNKSSVCLYINCLFPTFGCFHFQLSRSGKSSSSRDASPSLNSSNNDEKSDYVNIYCLSEERRLLENNYLYLFSKLQNIWNISLSKTILLANGKISYLMDCISTLTSKVIFLMTL